MRPPPPGRLACLSLLALGLVSLACVDEAFGPDARGTVSLQVSLVLPASTPAAWAPDGETLHVVVRRAGRVEPVVDTSVVIAGAASMSLLVPLSQAVERFVASAEVKYGATVLFLGFDVVQLRVATDTAVTLVAQYVGPGAGAATYTLAARDSSLAPGDTARLVPQVLDALGQLIPNVPVRYVASRPALISVDTAGLLSASAGPSDTARVTGYLPMGLSSDLVLSLGTVVTQPTGTKTWTGGAPGEPAAWSNAANWSPTGVPAAGDTVVIGATANDPVLTGADTVASLRVTGGTFILSSGQLLVTGDFATAGGAGGGAVTMESPTDTLRVLGNALLAGRPTEEGMNNGVLRVAGDFDVPGSGGTYGLAARDAHLTVLDGAQPQRLSFGGGQMGAQFGHLEIANTSGQLLIGGENTIPVTGKLRVSTAVTIDNGSGGNGDVQLEVGDSLVMAAGSRLTVVELTLGGGMAVAGEFVPAPGGSFRVRFNGTTQRIQAGLDYRDVEVNDDALLTGPTTFDGALDVTGTLDLAGHPLIVTGTFHTHNGDGRLLMRNALDRLEVRGAAIFEGDTIAGDLTAGVLRVAGTFEQLRYSNKRRTFRASGNHRTVLDGNGSQALRVADPTSFGHLEIATQGGPLGIAASEILIAERTFRISTAIDVAGVGSEGGFTLHVGDSAILAVGSRLEVGLLRVRGALVVGGTLDADNVEFAGTNQEIPPAVGYRNLTVTGNARLTGRTVATDGLWMHGPAATLTLNGQTLQIPRLLIGNGFGEPIENTTLVMQQATDSLIIAEDASFNSAMTAGSLTAGVLVVNGGFFQSMTPQAFQASGTHKTVLTGPPGASISFDHPGTGTNESAFRHLEIGPQADLFLRTNVSVSGMLSSQGAPGARVSSGTGATITAEGADVDGLTLSNVRLAVGGGLVDLDRVTFAQQAATATQLRITHPGAPAAFTFTGLRFLTTPTTGAFVHATDAAPADGQVLTIDLAGSTPADGSAQTLTSGGAIVNWTGGATGSGLTEVAAGLSISCGISTAGNSYCWGQNESGQAGDGSTDFRFSPVVVGGAITAATIGTGGGHSCLLDAGGAAWCWGSNTYGQLGDGTTSDRLAPVAVAGGHGFVSLAVSELHTCGVTAIGAAYCWGRNGSGQLGDGTTTDRSSPTLVVGGIAFASISAGIGQHTCARTQPGVAYCWGRNTSGQLGDGTTTQRLVPTPVAGGLAFAMLGASGNEHSCGVTTGGLGFCWGWNIFGEIGDGTTTQRLAPAAIAGGLSFASIYAGGNGFSCGVTTSDVAYCWGINNVGQLGDGTLNARTSPVAVSGGLSFRVLRAGFSHVIAVSTAGNTYSWGSLLGNGTTARSSVPVLLEPPTP